MRKAFNYWFESSSNGTIDIEDTGNTCLKAVGGRRPNEAGQYFLIVRTNDVGITQTITYGPTNVDENDDSPINICKCSYKRFEYDTFKVNKIISEFIMSINPTIVEETDIEEIRGRIKNFIDFIV